MGRILKARYFPKTPFLKAIADHNSSFIWKGFITAREVLISGGSWRVGNGKEIDISEDRWVAGQASGHVFMNPVTMAIPKRVCELLHGSGRSWNMNLLRILFPAKIVDVIQAIPLGNGQSTDTFIWDGASNGVYTVKSGYEVAKEILCQMVDSDPGLHFPFWNLIWGCTIPPNVKHFMWKLASKILPVKVSLLRRGINLPSLCDVCLEKEESLLHLFRDCIWAKTLWRLLNLEVVTTWGGIEFDDWLMCCFQVLNTDLLNVFMGALWWIWLNRNKVVFNQVCQLPLVATYLCKRWQVLNNSGKARMSGHSSGNHVRWKAPVGDFIKINCDATFLSSGQISYYGVIARDSAGKVLLADTGSSGNVESVLQAEAMAFLKVVNWVAFMGWRSVLIEGDCLDVVVAMQNEGRSFARCGVLLDELKLRSTLGVGSIQFIHVKRDANGVAHSLAHLYSCFTRFSCNRLPNSVVDAIAKDYCDV